MAREEKAIFTVLCMVYDGDKILLQDRVDPNWHGVSFPGGHVEHGESFVAAVKREVFEETGLTIHDVELAAIKQFQTEDDARYIVVFYKTNKFEGELKSSDEGRMFWATREEALKMEAVDDFEWHIKAFDDNNVSEFFYDRTDGNWIPRLF